MYLYNCICIVTCIYEYYWTPRPTLIEKNCLLCVETFISSFHLILFTIRNVKNDKKITFCLFYLHLHILTNYANSTNTLCLAQKIFGIFIIIYFRKHLNVEQNYCSRISSRMWSLTHSNCFFCLFCKLHGKMWPIIRK